MFCLKSLPTSAGRVAWLFALPVAALFAALLAATPAMAQPPGGRPLPPLSGFSVVPFNFGPPGARSLGMGGAFIGFADDATAAEANPAGLTQLSRPEVSIHGRSGSTEVEALDINAVSALDALNRARIVDSDLRPRERLANAFADDTRANFDPDTSEISFASYVRPFRRFTASIYYQQSANFSGENTFNAFDDSLLDSYRTRQQLDLGLENLGLSVAFKASPRLSVGASVRYSQLSIRALQDVRIDYGTDLELGQLGSGASLQEVEALGILDQQIQREEFLDEQGELTFNVGVLINPGGRLSLGLVYKDGGDFVVDGEGETFGCLAAEASGVLDCRPAGAGRRIDRLFKVPNFFGVGLGWRVTQRFRVAFDANRITYSDLTIAPPENPDAGPGVARQFVGNDDTTELRLGLEYVVFLGSSQLPLTLRAGVVDKPDHDSFRDIDSADTLTTAGLGLVLRERVQIDAAAQFGGQADASILSLVYRF